VRDWIGPPSGWTTRAWLVHPTRFGPATMVSAEEENFNPARIPQEVAGTPGGTRQSTDKERRKALLLRQIPA
jgi:hypothetical protein